MGEAVRRGRTEVPMNNGDEYDALTGWRRILYWKPRERSRIKRNYRRRVRRTISAAIRKMLGSMVFWTVVFDEDEPTAAGTRDFEVGGDMYRPRRRDGK